jgi:hypothetical protein
MMGRSPHKQEKKDNFQLFKARHLRARDGSRMAETAKGGLSSRQPNPKGALQYHEF